MAIKKKNANSSTSREKKVGFKSHVPLRLNLLIGLVFLAFLALIIQLAYVQIINGQVFVDKIASSTQKTVTVSTPRGMIYDANGKVLVGNSGVQAITYTKGSGTTAEQMRTVAKDLTKYVTVSADKTLTERDKKDYFLADEKNLKATRELLTDKETVDSHGDNLPESDVYKLIVDKVTAEQIAFSPEELAAATLFKRMNAAYSLNTIYLKNDGVTDTEIAQVAEHASELPGVATGMDWQRSYPYNSMLRSVLGTVSTEKSGLPAETADKYLAAGYALNDRVGTSYLEQQYESVLQGVKGQNTVDINSNGTITSQVASYTGQKGENLVSSIDIDFQAKVENILETQYKEMVTKKLTTYSDGVYAVVMNPKTGDVLAMSGFDHDLKTNTLTNNPLGVINNVYVPGSAIKGATVTAGYQNGVLNGDQVFIDQPLQFAGTTAKSSIFNRTFGNKIQMDTIRALSESSNVYMMHIALALMGTTYKANMSLPNDLAVFNKLRDVYAQYGLGSATGLDVPTYSNGLVTDTQNFLAADGKTILPGTMGLALDLSFGNYDSYSIMQLAQYAATIANSGDRYAARLIKGIYGANTDGTLGGTIQNFKPELLNTVDLTAAEWDIIHQGFYATTHASYGTATGFFSGAGYEVAAKTGTAETYYYPGDGTQHATINNSFVGYSTPDDPEVVVAVIIPHLNSSNGSYNVKMAKAIFDAYYASNK